MKWRDFDRTSTISLSVLDDRIADCVEDFRKLSDIMTADEYIRILQDTPAEIDHEGRFFADEVMILSDGRLINDFSERVKTSFILKGDVHLVFDSGHILNYTAAADFFAGSVKSELEIAC